MQTKSEDRRNISLLLSSKMLREIKNLFQGRRKTLDENLEIQQVIDLLTGLKKKVRISYSYSRNRENFKNITSNHAIHFVKEDFTPKEYRQATVSHQVYSGKKHYIDLVSTITTDSRQEPFARATITYEE